MVAESNVTTVPALSIVPEVPEVPEAPAPAPAPAPADIAAMLSNADDYGTVKAGADYDISIKRPAFLPVRETYERPVYDADGMPTKDAKGKVVTKSATRIKRDADGNVVLSDVRENTSQVQQRMVSTLRNLPQYRAVNLSWTVAGKGITYRVAFIGFAKNLSGKAQDAHVIFGVKQADGTFVDCPVQVRNIVSIAGTA